MPQQVLCNQNHCDAQIFCRFNRITNDTWCALSCCQSRPQWLQISSGHFSPQSKVKASILLQASLPHHDSHFDLKITASCWRFHEVLRGWIKVNFLGGALYFYDEQILWKDQNDQTPVFSLWLLFGLFTGFADVSFFAFLPRGNNGLCVRRSESRCTIMQQLMIVL